MTWNGEHTTREEKESKKRISTNPLNRLLNGFISTSQASFNPPRITVSKQPVSLKRFRLSVRSGKVTAAMCALLLTLPCVGRAEIPEAQAVRAIVGEAANQGEIGMTAVAEAIRNRQSLKGVFGTRRDLSREPAWVFKAAARAWRRSLVTNLVNGADHWENVKAFGIPAWAPGMIKTATIGDHVFFKAVHHGI